jgi:ubiquinone/menaquinone biosynthesis C-methylase UbiE
MLKRAKKRISKTGFRNYTLYLSDCRYLPFEDASFDVLMNQYMFDIFPVEDFIPILLEYKRVKSTERWRQNYTGQYDERRKMVKPVL